MKPVSLILAGLALIASALVMVPDLALGTSCAERAERAVSELGSIQQRGKVLSQIAAALEADRKGDEIACQRHLRTAEAIAQQVAE